MIISLWQTNPLGDDFTLMITMRSRYNSRCKYCGKPIAIGDSICKGEDGWGHPSCVSADFITPEVTIRELQVTKQFQSAAEDVSADAFTPVVAEVKQQREFIPSAYQQAIFDAGANGTGNLVVSATAGSGKTRTIQEFITRYIPKNKSWIYLVFNKRNQTEAQDKFGDMSNGLVSTFHSFCLNNAIKKAYGKVKIDDKKVWQALDKVSDKDAEKELRPIANKVIGLLKNTLTNPDDYDGIMSMCDHYGVELNGSTSRILEIVRDAMSMLTANTATVDFDDMLYLTVKNNLALPTYDYVLVDETQDLNAVQIAIVLRIQKVGGRTICCGDANQAVYGFRGADADAMDKVIEALKAEVLPLSLCYRNAKAIVALVNAELPHIKHECLDDAPQGEVLTIEAQDLQACVKPGDMVICRTNAPLVKPCFQLIQHGIKAVIMGRSIGEELVNLINRISKRLPTDNLEFILAALSEYRVQEVSRLMAQGKESTAQALEDKIDTIYALADGCALLPELIKKAETIFSDDAKGVVFSSAHRAKGLEADSVFILNYSLMPHPMAVKSGKEWQLKQETNCKFVALTRAKLKLYFLKEAK